ncbi:hypothetical protein HNP29_004358 [Pseudomonas alcaligenes]|nr:hypothetical protein [Pseudomonas alcaligenes]
MFERIKHTGNFGRMTTCCYADGEVTGQVTFFVDDLRVRILSEIGPNDHLRDCIVIYRFNPVIGLHKPIVKDEINSYAKQPQ